MPSPSLQEHSLRPLWVFTFSLLFFLWFWKVIGWVLLTDYIRFFHHAARLWYYKQLNNLLFFWGMSMFRTTTNVLFKGPRRPTHDVTDYNHNIKTHDLMSYSKMLDLLMKDHLHIDKAVIVGLSFYFSELFLSFAFHLSPPDTFSSLYLLFGLFLSLHRNHPHRGACHLYLLISSIPVPLGALLHLNVRLMRPPHPPDTSA